MAYVNLIENDQGDLLEVEYYCSDWCATQSPNYNGWYGCVELEYLEVCVNCGQKIEGTYVS